MKNITDLIHVLYFCGVHIRKNILSELIDENFIVESRRSFN